MTTENTTEKKSNACCENCPHWKGTSNGDHGVCRLYPQVVMKRGRELCGQHPYFGQMVIVAQKKNTVREG